MGDFLFLPYEIDGNGTGAITTNVMSCMFVRVPRDIVVVSANFVRQTSAAILMGMGLYSPGSLAKVVSFDGMSCAAPLNQSKNIPAFLLTAGLYIYAVGVTGGSPTFFAAGNNNTTLRRSCGLAGQTPSGVNVDANGNCPGNLVSIRAVLAINMPQCILLSN